MILKYINIWRLIRRLYIGWMKRRDKFIIKVIYSLNIYVLILNLFNIMYFFWMIFFNLRKEIFCYIIIFWFVFVFWFFKDIYWEWVCFFEVFFILVDGYFFFFEYKLNFVLKYSVDLFWIIVYYWRSWKIFLFIFFILEFFFRKE